MVVEVAEIAFALLMLAYLAWSPASAATKTNAGLGSMLVNAAGIAILNNLIGAPAVSIMMQVSWIAVLILVFSMIAPAPPRKMLLLSLVAASMDPLAAFAARLTGAHDLVAARSRLLMFMPNYVWRWW